MKKFYLPILSALFLCSSLFAASPEEESEKTAQAWLKLVDEGKYLESWQTASPRLQLTMKQNEWQQLMDVSRKPLGSVKSRTIAEQAPAHNPQGLAAGEYMVILYKSSFANAPTAEELLTLAQGDDGKWRVLTYHVKQESKK